MRSRVPAAVIAIVFALLFGWFLYLALVNLLSVPPTYEAVGFGDRIPWALLVAGVALPALLYAAALWLGLRQSLTNRVLVFAAGLAATAATSFGLYALSAYLVSLG